MPALTPDAPARRTALWWCVLVGVLLAEFLVFDRATSRHYAWVYPRWNDQIQYLGEVYHGHDLAVQDGLARGLAATATKPSAQGLLTAVGTVGVMQLAGASRSAALAVNMLAWLALQVVCFGFVLRRYRSPTLAWLAVGLLLLWQTPFSAGPGSAWDFRLDFVCACLFGVTLVSALATEGFGSRGRSLLFGLMVALTLLERFLSGTYFVLIYAGLTVWVAGDAQRWRRWGNLALSAVLAAALAGPFFWINRQTVWEYYFLGHFSGPERAIRESHLGLGGSFQWVFFELFHSHLNAWFVGTVVLASVVLVIARSWAAKAAEAPPLGRGPSLLVPTLIFFGAPAVILALHDEKSYVVLSCLVPPVVLLVIIGWARCGAGAGNFPAWVRAVLLTVVLGAGAAHFVLLQAQPFYDAGFASDARALNRFADRIADLSDQAGLATPQIAVDQVTDSMDAQVLRLLCYERQHKWYAFQMTLPTGIMENKAEILMAQIEKSDFVILHADASDGMYPFDHEMTRMLPQTTAWCDRHLKVASRFSLFGRAWTLYVKPEVWAKARP